MSVCTIRKGVIDPPLGANGFHPPMGGAFNFTSLSAQADTREDTGISNIPDLWAASARPYSAASDLCCMFSRPAVEAVFTAASSLKLNHPGIRRFFLCGAYERCT